MQAMLHCLHGLRSLLHAARMQRWLLVMLCAPLSGAWAQTPACDPPVPRAVGLRVFQQVAADYAQRAARPAAASAWLLCLQRGHRELAETLMLHKRGLTDPARAPAALEDAFLHFVINTADPVLDERPAPEAERLARQYREGLLLPPAPEADADAACGPVAPTLGRLRCLGQAANQQRYGRGDVVPVHLLDFVASAGVYSTLDATWMSELAALAYWDAPLVRQQLMRWGFTPVADIQHPATDTHGFLARRGPLLVLAFRGTSAFKDFLTDADVRRVRTSWTAGTVHNGFQRAADAVWKPLVDALGPPQAQTRDIVLTGHSLGAALAQLTALRLVQAGYRVRGVYTFGTPRVGDAEFAADFDRQLGLRSFPHVNHQDMVARVPPAALGFQAVAQANTRQFTGGGHEMKLWEPSNTDARAPPANWKRQAQDSISRATDFLPDALRPQALHAAPQAGPRFNLYSTSFQKGPLDDHGSFEYLFKLVCATIEYELWPLESRQAEAAPPAAPQGAAASPRLPR